MANKTTENEGITRPVAAVSSTSSLDSFVASLPQHSTQEESSIPLSISQQSLTSPIIPPFNDNVQGSINQSVNNPLAAQSPAVRTLAVVPSAAPVPIVPSNTVVTSVVGVPSKLAPANNSVAEFLYQLTKMLTDDNKEVIEWSNSKIEVHNPYKLASEVLPKYFRHSKFASFQRQLNYFGFRKLAGKGRMAPCSYVNDSATSELRSLLLIKVSFPSCTSYAV
jgi:HSF-type DNA-binding